MKKLTILAIHNYYQQRGGEDVVFEEEVTALKKAGHTVIVYTKNNNIIEEFSLKDKIKYVLSFFLKKKFRDLQDIIDNNKIDIAHIHNVFPLITPHIYAFLKKNKIKIVQTLHNYRFLCPNGLFFVHNKVCTKCLKGNFNHCIYNRCYKNSLVHSFLYSHIIKKSRKSIKQNIDAFIALTGFTKKMFVEAGFDKNKIFIKDNASTSMQTIKRKKKKYFLYMGRLSQEKGIDFLLEAFAKMPEFTLWVAGTGEKLEYYKRKYNKNNIKFLGFVSGDKKVKILSEATAMIIPSVCYENYPLAIIDAFNIGIPVIGSQIGGIPYIINDKKTGLLFEPSNFESLKKALINFTDNASLRNRMGYAALDYFEENNKMENNIKKLLSIYEEIL